MSTRKLGDLFKESDLAPEATTEPAPVVAEEVKAAPTAPAAKTQAKKSAKKTTATLKSGSNQGAKKVGRPPMSAGKASELERKQLALTPEQADGLILLCRKLNRQRDDSVPGAEPATESGLVRCAVEVLLSVADKLEGNNETEILQSLQEALK